ncbi:MAG: hypothetical protein ACLS7Z_08770 [Christensenellales bacterium]
MGKRAEADAARLLRADSRTVGRNADHAEQAHALAPARVQTLCVLVDVLYATKKTEQARRMLHILCGARKAWMLAERSR